MNAFGMKHFSDDFTAVVWKACDISESYSQGSGVYTKARAGSPLWIKEYYTGDELEHALCYVHPV